MLDPLVYAEVDKASQRMNVFVDGVKTHTWKVSTGTYEHDTPVGTHTMPYRMHTMWRSRKYDNAPMPYAIFFDGGYAVHGTKALSRLGRPASHGCIRIDTKHAKMLFNLVKKHGRHRTKIAINGDYKWSPAQKVFASKTRARNRVRTARRRAAARHASIVRSDSVKLRRVSYSRAEPRRTTRNARRSSSRRAETRKYSTRKFSNRRHSARRYDTRRKNRQVRYRKISDIFKFGRSKRRGLFR